MLCKRTLETIQPFDNDIKRLKKKHYDINKIREPLQALIENDVDGFVACKPGILMPGLHAMRVFC